MKNVVPKIAFIGAGKMAEALLSRQRMLQSIIVSDIDKSRLRYLKNKYQLKIAASNSAAFDAGDIVILAVKPQQMGEVIGEVSRKAEKSRLSLSDIMIRDPDVQSGQKSRKQLIISIAAGITLAYLQKHLPGYHIIRAMPNNPCLTGMGITALAAGKGAGEKAKAKTRKIFEAVGEVVEVPEEWMDAVTGLSGSGPAFIYLVIEALAEAGIRHGIKKTTAEKLAIHTVLGAAHTMLKTGESAAKLREMVTSPGGTTEEGLKKLEEGALYHDLIKAVTAAAEKSKRIAEHYAAERN